MKPDVIDEWIGRRIRELREARGMSQGDLARLIGWHRPTITIVEHGRQGLHARDLWVFAAAFGVPQADLLPKELPEP